MAIELEGLEFQIKSDSDKAISSIDKLTNSLTKLRTATRGGLGLNSTINQLNRLNDAVSGLRLDNLKDLDGVSSNLERLANAIEKFRNVSTVRIPPSLATRLNELVTTGRGIDPGDIANLNMLADTLERFKGMQDVRIPRLNSVSVDSAVPASVTAAVTPDLMTPIESESEQVTAAVREITNTVDDATASTGRFRQMLNWLSHQFNTTAETSQKTANGLKNVVKYATVLPRLLGSRLASKVKQTTSAFGQFFSSIKRIAMYRLIRSMFSALTKGFTEGMKNLYQYSLIMGTDFAKSMDKLATSALYLKNSLAAMVSPIINALAPAIDLIVDKIVDLMNIVNMVISKLTGKDTYTAAKKYGIAWQEAASDVEDAAKTIKRYVLGFDELNILGKNKDGKGSSDKDALDYAAMFEERAIDSGVGSIIDKLKELVMQGDWSGIGQTIGTKINEAVNNIPWARTGQIIGQGINGAVQTVYSFLDTVNFTNIGSGIATTLNNVLEEIDFSFVGRLIVKPFTALADLIIGFITTTDWGLVAKSLSDTLVGMFDEADKWLEKVDWFELGTSLYNALYDIVTNLDYASIASSLFRLLGAAIRAAFTTVFSIGFNIGEDFWAWFDNEVNESSNADSFAENILLKIANGFAKIGDFIIQNGFEPFMEGLLGKDGWYEARKNWEDGAKILIEGMTDIGSWIESAIIDPIKEWFTNNEFIEYMEEVGGDAIDGFLNALAAPFVGIYNWLKEHIIDPLIKQIKKLLGIASPSKVMYAIGEDTINGFLNALAAPFIAIGTWVKTNIIDPLVKALGSGNLAEFMVGVKNTATEWWSSVKKWWSEKATKALEFLACVKDTAAQWWTDTKSWWNKAAAKGLDFVANCQAKLTTWTNNLKDVIISAKSKFTSWASGLGEVVMSTKAKFTSWVRGISENITMATKAKFTSWARGISETITMASKAKFTSWVRGISDTITMASKAKFTTWMNGLTDVAMSAKAKFNTWSNNLSTVVSIPSMAKLTTWANNLITAVSINSKANFNTWKSSLTDVWSNAQARFNTWKSSLGGVWTNAQAVLNTWKSSLGSVWTNAQAKLTSWIDNLSNKVLNFTARITGTTSSYFASGGVITAKGAVNWNMIPKYADGSINAHGTMFVAGESGAEVVGHVNGRTEVLNRSQLGQIMHTSIVDGMAQFASYLKVINSHMTTCANAQINATLLTAEAINRNLANVAMPTDYNIMNDLDAMRYGMYDEASTDAIAEGVRNAMYDSTSRQNELLREQNELLREILNKDTTVEVTASSITSAISRKNQRDGKATIPVSTS